MVNIVDVYYNIFYLSYLCLVYHIYVWLPYILVSFFIINSFTLYVYFGHKIALT